MACGSTSSPSRTPSPNAGASSCAARTPTGPTSTRTAGCSPSSTWSSSRSPSAWAPSARTPPTSRWRSTRSSCPSSATTSPPSSSAPATATSRPLVGKLRELNRRVIGVGLQASTSKLLPPACDEFLFYERLEGVEIGDRRRQTRAERKASRNAEVAAAVAVRRAADPGPDERVADPAPVPGPPPGGEPEDGFATDDGFAPTPGSSPTWRGAAARAGWQRLGRRPRQARRPDPVGPCSARPAARSWHPACRRAILRKDPTFSGRTTASARSASCCATSPTATSSS